MYDPELLQAIRQEVALYAGADDLSGNLFFIEPSDLQLHVERLYVGGELAGSAHFDGRRLVLNITGLTASGARALRRNESRHPAR